MTFKCNTFSDLERKALHETYVAFYYLFIYIYWSRGWIVSVYAQDKCSICMSSSPLVFSGQTLLVNLWELSSYSQHHQREWIVKPQFLDDQTYKCHAMFFLGF
jgi:hypothetical protein